MTGIPIIGGGRIGRFSPAWIAPVITSTPVLVGTSGVAYEYTVTATDADPHDVVTFSLYTKPTGMTIDASTGVISWTPAAGQVGSNSVVVIVTDSHGRTDSQSFAVNVASDTSFYAPFITSLPDTLATAGVAYSYAPTATDADSGDTQTWTLETAPTGMTITAATGAIAWTPTTGQAGVNAVTVRVTDSHTLYDEQSWNVTVSADAEGPQLPEEYDVPAYSLPTAGTTRYAYGDEGANGSYNVTLTAALAAAQQGDVIILKAGSTYTGNFTIPALGGDDWLYIISSELASLTEGTRVGPTDTTNMAKIVGTTSGAYALQTNGASKKVRICGLEITKTEDQASPVTLLRFGYKSNSQVTSYADLPTDIVVDRCYIHGTGDGASSDTKQGILLEGERMAVIDNYIANIHRSATYDCQAILSVNGAGLYVIENNYIEASTENIMFGGGTVRITDISSDHRAYAENGDSHGLLQSDIVVRGNLISKPASWYPDDVTYGGVAHNCKNLFECKSARRVLVEGNVLERSFDHSDLPASQDGVAINLKSVNQGGGPAIWQQTTDVTVRYNVIRHSVKVARVSGLLDSDAEAVEVGPVHIHDNVCYDISYATWGEGSADQQPGPFECGEGFPWLKIENNTVVSSDGLYAVYVSYGSGDSNEHNGAFMFSNNIIPRNTYGVKGPIAEGITSLATLLPGYTFTNNIIVGTDGSASYPAGQYWPATDAAVGFVDDTFDDLADCAIDAESTYYGLGIGADVDAVADAINASDW